MPTPTIEEAEVQVAIWERRERIARDTRCEWQGILKLLQQQQQERKTEDSAGEQEQY